MSEEPVAESRQDTAAAKTAQDSTSDSAAIPPSPPSILHKTCTQEGSTSSPQHHVRIAGGASSIPPISPRARHLKDRNASLKNLQHSPRFPRKDRSMSLGAFPPSWNNLSGTTAYDNNIHSTFIPLSPYSPSASPITSMYHPGGAAASSSWNSSTGSSSCMPFMPNLSHNGPTRAAMEAAIQSERLRTKEKEKEEESLSADELRGVLKRERARMSKIQADLAAMRAAAVQCQADAEIHEEGRINNLMRRVECLQQEKGRIIVELEREEEMLTNTLQKKLDEVKREKMLLEQQIEREQLSHTDLKSKLTTIRQNKTTSGVEDDEKVGVEEMKQEQDTSSEAEKDSIHSLPTSIPESDEDEQDDKE